ncbi:isoamylase 1 [Quercus suber]|uniref:Isoamylase 1 n=1 Tax=Quercus suber TaxID=58331 RepID=A0AAW0L1Y3_QUESU
MPMPLSPSHSHSHSLSLSFNPNGANSSMCFTLTIITTNTLPNQKRSGPSRLKIVNARRESGGGIGVGGGAEVDTAVAGSLTTFGATACDGGVNFAIFFANAVSATLCFISLFDLHDNKVTEQISLDPLTNKIGDVWHVFLTGDFKDMLYGYKFDGKFIPDEGLYYDSSRILLDPYAKAIISRGEFGTLGADGNC